MIEMYWDPVPYIGPIPINWYGINFAIAFLAAGWLVWKSVPGFEIPREKIEGLITWIFFGTFVGGRMYFVVQNDIGTYIAEPWRTIALWEGGLAFFGGILGAFLYARGTDCRSPVLRICSLQRFRFGAAIGRISCGLDGMDYGTPTNLPWGVVFTHPDTYAPLGGVPRHPVVSKNRI